MSEPHPFIYMARHGETAWSLSGQHTGLTDLPLTERGRRNACRLGERLKGLTFVKVLISPLQRAAGTCQLAGFGASADVDRDLLEWDYGQYEGLRTAEIQAKRPEWQLLGICTDLVLCAASGLQLASGFARPGERVSRYGQSAAPGRHRGYSRRCFNHTAEGDHLYGKDTGLRWGRGEIPQ